MITVIKTECGEQLILSHAGQSLFFPLLPSNQMTAASVFLEVLFDCVGGIERERERRKREGRKKKRAKRERESGERERERRKRGEREKTTPDERPA